MKYVNAEKNELTIKKSEMNTQQRPITPQQYFACLKCCTYYHIL